MVENFLTNIRTVFEEANFPFELYGVVVFGSRVKGKATTYSDFDVLVAADGIHPKRHRRGDEIIAIKKSLAGIPLDILLLSPSEVISNFKNHNPLFLDIAEDGIILFDRKNFLKGLIEETKEYINKKGIKKLKEGWQFPVQHGIATYLSKISNKDFSMAMFKDGERDYSIAKKLLDERFFDKSVYHSQQSIEKFIKSILAAFGVFQKTHFVGEILIELLKGQEIPLSWKENLEKIAEISESIEPEVSLSRYPGIINDRLWLPYEEYERTDAEVAERKAGEVFCVTEDFLRFWFSQAK